MRTRRADSRQREGPGCPPPNTAAPHRRARANRLARDACACSFRAPQIWRTRPTPRVMSLILFLLVSGILLGLAYRWYGGFLARFLDLQGGTTTPAHTKRDGLDYEPARWSWLLPQHFSAIAAAGPVVGPILAATYFGWLPAWIWIIVGSIFVGGVHDLMTLVASVRHESKSIAEVVRRYMNRRAYLLFLTCIWISLIYVIIAFADVTAGTFVQKASAAGGDAPGPRRGRTSACTGPLRPRE